MRPVLAALFVLLAAALPGAAQVRAPSPAPAPTAPPLLSGALGQGTLGLPLRPLGSTPILPGLAVVGDPAPQCRSQCTKARFICDGDEGDCGDRWRTCVAACRGQSRP